MAKLVWFATLFATVACGDNIIVPEPDGPGPGPDPFVPPTPFAVPLSTGGPDQLQSVIATPDGKFLAAGFAATTAAGPRMVTLVKYSATGVDTSFGTNGVVTTTVEFRGGTDEIDLIAQDDGKLLVSATVVSPTNPADRDIAVIRLLADGKPDDTFSGDGVAVHSLNDGTLNGSTLVGLDAARALAVDANGIYVHALSRALGESGGLPRRDTDFTVVRLTSTGEIDDTFGTNGQFRFDVGEAPATARMIKTLPGGDILVGGYSATPGVGNKPQPVLFRLDSSGDLVTGFAMGGVFHEAILPEQTEVYNVAIHGTHFVTAGYGRVSGDVNDYISLRFNLTNGQRDLAWGGTSNGAVVFDPSGTKANANCRTGIALPDGKTLMAGSIGAVNTPGQDAVFAILDAQGQLDTAYGDGIHAFKLGGDGADQFWGATVAGNLVTVVGFKSTGGAQADNNNDDAFAAVFELR